MSYYQQTCQSVYPSYPAPCQPVCTPTCQPVCPTPVYQPVPVAVPVAQPVYTACATTQGNYCCPPHNAFGRKVAGAAVGGGIGYLACNGRFLPTAAGAVGGFVLGGHLDRNRCGYGGGCGNGYC